MSEMNEVVVRTSVLAKPVPFYTHTSMSILSRKRLDVAGYTPHQRPLLLSPIPTVLQFLTRRRHKVLNCEAGSWGASPGIDS